MQQLSRTLTTILLLCVCASAQELKTARLGDFKLESGEVIRDCRVGYRTFGTLNAEKSNAILFPTWFTGTTNDLVDLIGPGKLVDSSKYFVITVDALGNGVSSSPSNSEAQPRMRFPRISIRDMVNSQHQLLTQVLHINHLRAVMGISMGGMQTFQWIVFYPDFMDKAIPIVGSPRLAPYDLLLWQAMLDAIQADPAWKNGDYTEEPATTELAELTSLAIMTPQRYNQQTTREKFAESLAQAKQRAAGFDANNRIRQAQAMMSLDVSAPFGGSMERAAAAVRAKVLVIVARQDHVVTPGAALEFAALLHGEVLELEGDCGHLAFRCEADKIVPPVAAFLEK